MTPYKVDSFRWTCSTSEYDPTKELAISIEQKMLYRYKLMGKQIGRRAIDVHQLQDLVLGPGLEPNKRELGIRALDATIATHLNLPLRVSPDRDTIIMPRAAVFLKPVVLDEVKTEPYRMPRHILDGFEDSVGSTVLVSKVAESQLLRHNPELEGEISAKFAAINGTGGLHEISLRYSDQDTYSYYSPRVTLPR